MSLDVYLSEKRQRVFGANITHNLGPMAAACGVYFACWRPEEINCKKAKHIIPMLESGVKLLKQFPEFYKRFNPDNGWGSYDGFVPWLEEYLLACTQHPEATIYACR